MSFSQCHSRNSSHLRGAVDNSKQRVPFRVCCQASHKFPCGSADGSNSSHGSSLPLAVHRRQCLIAAAAAGAMLWPSQQAALAQEGKMPKAYEDTARKLVDALREAISTDLSDAEEREVRRAADPAKGLVREFLTRWRGQAAVEGEESYRQLTSAIQQLGQYYQRNGQRARMSGEVGRAVLDALDAAEAALGPPEDKASLLPFF